MGAPSRTYFCKNGHIVEHYDHYKMEPDKEGESLCSVCDSIETKCVMDWADPDYWPEGATDDPLVPVSPVSTVEEICPTCKHRTHDTRYDVSELFKLDDE